VGGGLEGGDDIKRRTRAALAGAHQRAQGQPLQDGYPCRPRRNEETAMARSCRRVTSLVHNREVKPVLRCNLRCFCRTRRRTCTSSRCCNVVTPVGAGPVRGKEHKGRRGAAAESETLSLVNMGLAAHPERPVRPLRPAAPSTQRQAGAVNVGPSCGSSRSSTTDEQPTTPTKVVGAPTCTPPRAPA